MLQIFPLLVNDLIFSYLKFGDIMKFRYLNKKTKKYVECNTNVQIFLKYYYDKSKIGKINFYIFLIKNNLHLRLSFDQI